MWGNGITKSHIAQFDVVAFLYMFVGCTPKVFCFHGCLVLESKSRVDVRIVVILCAFPVIHQVAVGIGGAVNRMLCNQHACFYIAHYMTAGIDKHEGKIKTFIT